MEYNQLVILGESSNQLYREVFDTKKRLLRRLLIIILGMRKIHMKVNTKDGLLGHPDFPEKINALLYASGAYLERG